MPKSLSNPILGVSHAKGNPVPNFLGGEMKAEIILVNSETGEMIGSIPDIDVPVTVDIQVLYADGELEYLDSGIYLPL